MRREGSDLVACSRPRKCQRTRPARRRERRARAPSPTAPGRSSRRCRPHRPPARRAPRRRERPWSPRRAATPRPPAGRCGREPSATRARPRGLDHGRRPRHRRGRSTRPSAWRPSSSAGAVRVERSAVARRAGVGGVDQFDPGAARAPRATAMGRSSAGRPAACGRGRRGRIEPRCGRGRRRRTRSTRGGCKARARTSDRARRARRMASTVASITPASMPLQPAWTSRPRRVRAHDGDGCAVGDVAPTARARRGR